jgi:Xaa-Pro aminopeptidase
MIFKERCLKVKEFISKNNIDAFLVLNPSNRYYLSGFELKDVQYNESAGFLLITRDKVFLFTDSRYLEEAKKHYADDIFIYKENKFDFIKQKIKELNLNNIGFEYDFFPYIFWENLKDLNLFSFKGIIENIRKIKNKEEIEKIRKANKLVYEVFEIIPSYLKEGITEKELAWFIEKFFREKGAQGTSFEPIVAFGKNSALPHARPSEKKLKKETVVLIDIGCRYLDYCSDQTRTFWFGENPPEYFLTTLELVKRAQEKAINFIQAGKIIKDAYWLVKEYFQAKGVGEYFTHALGHGIGLDTHEIPSLSPANENKFEENMVVTVEPGLYYPEWGGVRWEYMVLVTKEGVEII